MKTQTPLNKGHKSENIALNYLIAKGFSLLDRNYHTTYGEIDLIFDYDGFTVFVEVKSVNSSHYSIYSTLTKKKKSRMKKAANSYLLKKDLLSKPWRFDFIGVTINKDLESEVEHFEYLEI